MSHPSHPFRYDLPKNCREIIIFMYGYVSCHKAAEEYRGIIRAFKHRVSNIDNCRHTLGTNQSHSTMHSDCLRKQTALVRTARKMKRTKLANTPSHCWEFPCHGTLLKGNDDIRTVVERINNAKRAYFASPFLLNSHIIPRYIKIRTCKTLIRLIILYRAEAWAINVDACERWRVPQRKIVWRICGLLYSSGHWRIRYHHALRLGMKTWTL